MSMIKMRLVDLYLTWVDPWKLWHQIVPRCLTSLNERLRSLWIWGELTVCVFSKFFQNSPASSVGERNKSRWVYTLATSAHQASGGPSICTNHDLDYQSNQAPLGGSCPPQWSSPQSRRGQNDQLSDRSPCKYSPDRSNTVLFFKFSHRACFPGPRCAHH